MSQARRTAIDTTSSSGCEMSSIVVCSKPDFRTLWPGSPKPARLTKAGPAQVVTTRSHRLGPISKSWWGQSKQPETRPELRAQPRRGRRRPKYSMTASARNLTEAGAAATRVLDDGERALPGGSAEAGAAATKVLDDGERAPPGGYRRRYHTPARAHACSRHRFHCIDLLVLEFRSSLHKSRAGPSCDVLWRMGVIIAVV